ncbi:unnamed protein product [Didymodactylos carnosus]|uniref:Superoxide dismutase copper/zinc binding domain-containing protein n=1 Tax=Didymodactylos carnosus TaxID=1234261 RepID=A0A814CUJ9_9BILA|nr:unnamed protein product [Didymodactylos carnosus]CAF0970100.1 unnamed protein product [Didymodactylos carnosus]CAF3721144.1 unnamed protein product [Didymodactylos carnosus]CAF3741542.1 unnamed protein product [Didymodactylos carnosus]
MFSLPLVLLVLFINVFGVIGDTPIFATATLHPDSNSSAKGFVIFTQLNPSSSVVVRGIINGLVPNTQYHGFHVHEKNPGNTTNCTAAGAHFNPYMKWHGGPDDTIDQRHVGDLGNIHSNEFGTAYVLINDSIIQLANQTQSILNRTIIVHRDVDDLGRGGQVDSNTTGLFYI